MNTLLNYVATLYGAPLIREENNQMIEEYNNYLESQSTKLVFTDHLAPITPLLDVDIKLPLSESNAGNVNKTYNVLKLEGKEGDANLGTYYYFVRSFKRLANNVCALSCHLDVLNTFGEDITNGMGEKTLIERQHVDRFNADDTYVFGSNTVISKKIDPISEGIAPSMVKSADEEIHNRNASFNNEIFHLVFRGDATDTSPIQSFCALDKSYLLRAGTSANKISIWANAGNAPYRYSLYLIASENASYDFEDENGTHYNASRFPSVAMWRFIYASKLNADHSITPYTDILVYGYDYTGQQTQFIDVGGLFTFNTISKLRIGNYCLYASIADHPEQAVETRPYIVSLFPAWEITSNREDAIYCLPFNALPKTDSTLIKCISLPYNPSELTYTGSPKVLKLERFEETHDHNVSSMFFSNLGILQALPVATDYFANLAEGDDSADFIQTIPTADIVEDKDRFIEDPKLMHSDFYINKYVYDNFTMTIKSEYVDTSNMVGHGSYNVLTFKPSNTINSNFLFKVEMLDGSTDESIYTTQGDFAEYLTANRNNETPIYNSGYIDYIKTGYNYDRKLRALNIGTGFMNLGTSAMQGGMTGMLSSKSPVGAMAGVTVSAMNSLVNTFVSGERANMAVNKRLQELEIQGVNVRSVDDIDLMTYYSHNKLKRMKYEPIPVMKKQLDDLFYYYGYLRGVQGAPEWYSRLWFNFVQAQPYWTLSTLIDNSYLLEITEKINAGVTLFHAVYLSGEEAPAWDLAQEKENWEMSFYN